MSLVRTINVTVSNPGSGNKYYLDGVVAPIANLGVGGSFRFDQSDSSNAVGGVHPLRFATAADAAGGTQYTTGVTTNGTPGSAGAYTEIEVTSSTPTTLYYYCTNHSGMGNSINVSQNSWGALTYNQGTWNSPNGDAAAITGLQANTALSSATISAEILTGWGRGAWNSAAWNAAPSAFVTINGLQQLEVDITVGLGWGRNGYNTGAWNSASGFVLVGTGSLFPITGQSLTSNLGSLTSVTGTAIINVIGQQANTAVGQTIADSSVFHPITGLVANTFIGTYSIAASGAITIITPAFDLTSSVGNITTGTANTLDIIGQGINITSGNVSTATGNTIEITGINANANVSSITISSSHFLAITGEEMTSALATIIPDSNNFLNMTGIQANVTPVDLRFWNDISDGNTEIWTNI